MKQAKLLSNEKSEDMLPEDDIYVKLTIQKVPSVLVREFAEKIAGPYYTGGISEAIKDLMWEAVQSQKLDQHTRECWK
jgi:hypothetical protein